MTPMGPREGVLRLAGPGRHARSPTAMPRSGEGPDRRCAGGPADDTLGRSGGAARRASTTSVRAGAASSATSLGRRNALQVRRRPRSLDDHATARFAASMAHRRSTPLWGPAALDARASSRPEHARGPFGGAPLGELTAGTLRFASLCRHADRTRPVGTGTVRTAARCPASRGRPPDPWPDLRCRVGPPRQALRRRPTPHR
jgi:hypothetical protein